MLWAWIGAAAGSVDLWTAKAYSAWLLHKHTKADRLRAIVSSSSTTSSMGNVGQAAYGAVNAILDGLMEQRARAVQ